MGVPAAPGRARPTRDFKPKKWEIAIQDISVWAWVERVVELWRLIFDESRQKGGSLFAQWLDNSKYQKCAFISKCLGFPKKMRGFEQDRVQAWEIYNEEKKKGSAARAAARQVKDKIETKVASQKEYLKNTCGNDERDQDAPGVGLCKKLTVSWIEGEVDPAQFIDNDAPPGLLNDRVIWCDPSPSGLRSAIAYALTAAGVGGFESTTNDDVVSVQRINEGSLVLLDTDKTAKALWVSPDSKIGAIVANRKSER